MIFLLGISVYVVFIIEFVRLFVGSPACAACSIGMCAHKRASSSARARPSARACVKHLSEMITAVAAAARKNKNVHKKAGSCVCANQTSERATATYMHIYIYITTTTLGTHKLRTSRTHIFQTFVPGRKMGGQRQGIFMTYVYI